jgi:hypothetical protein
MANNSPSSQPPANLLTLKIIWGALTFSQLIYLVVAFFVVEPPEQPPEQMMSIIFFGIGCSNILLGTFGVEKFMKAQDFSSFVTQCIIKWAMIESGVIFGLVNKFQGGLDAIMVGLYVLALFGMIKTFPSDIPTSENSD